MKNCCKYKSILFFIGASVLLLLGRYFFIGEKKESNSQIIAEEDEAEIKKENDNIHQTDIIENTQEIKEEIKKEEIEEKIELPSKIKLEVPFTSQAPYAMWDEIHEETCEEASLLMVAYFHQNKTISRETAEEELLEMVEFQNENYGDFKDSDMKQLKQLAEEYFNLKSGEIIDNPDVEDLKNILVGGRPIIVPAAGRLLGNPNFTPPGPLYHNLVLIGYDDERKVFITNDPGTRKGQNYEYDYEILLNAIHDFPGEKSEIEKGDKKVLFF